MNKVGVLLTMVVIAIMGGFIIACVSHTFTELMDVRQPASTHKDLTPSGVNVSGTRYKAVVDVADGYSHNDTFVYGRYVHGHFSASGKLFVWGGGK